MELPPISEGSDGLVELARLETASFIEILEVRARPDGLVFFCSGVQGVSVVDVSNPSAMVRLAQAGSSLGSFSYPRCQHLAWAPLDDTRELLFITNRGDEIQQEPFITAFERSQNNLVERASWAPPEGHSIEGIDAVGDLLYVALHGGGLEIVRFDGVRFSSVGRVSLVNAWNVRVRDGIAYVADGLGGLATVDVSDPVNPELLGRVELPAAAQFLELDPDRAIAYVAASSAGLVTVDIADATAPVVLGRGDTPGTALQVAYARDHVVVADFNDVRVFSVSDPSAPALLTTERIETPGSFSRVLGASIADDVVFVGEWTGFYSFVLNPQARAPDIFVLDHNIEFGEVAPEASSAVSVIVGNEGQETLNIASIASSEAFQTDISSLDLEPGESGVIEVLYTATSTSMEVGTLTLLSNDPDEAELELVLVGNRPGVGVGDRVDEIEVELLDGGTWRLSEHRGEVVLLAYFATF